MAVSTIPGLPFYSFHKDYRVTFLLPIFSDWKKKKFLCVLVFSSGSIPGLIASWYFLCNWAIQVPLNKWILNGKFLQDMLHVTAESISPGYWHTQGPYQSSGDFLMRSQPWRLKSQYATFASHLRWCPGAWHRGVCNQYLETDKRHGLWTRVDFSLVQL